MELVLIPFMSYPFSLHLLYCLYSFFSFGYCKIAQDRILKFFKGLGFLVGHCFRFRFMVKFFIKRKNKYLFLSYLGCLDNPWIVEEQLHITQVLSQAGHPFLGPWSLGNQHGDVLSLSHILRMPTFKWSHSSTHVQNSSCTSIGYTNDQVNIR